MTAPAAPYLYTEARLNIEPAYPDSTLHISTASASTFSSRKRARQDEDETGLDEDSYAKKHLASEASVFFRRSSRSPRSFLWRILDDRKLLQIQCIDLVQSRKNNQECVLTYALSFANPIRHNGIAFGDPEERDALDIFVLTERNELFTFSLSKGILLRSSVPSTSDFDPTSCFRCYTPSSFSFRYPYKLIATSSLELLISLHDGGLLRLERKAGDNGSSWRETFFSEGGWGSSFKGFIPWIGHNTIRFGNTDLEPSTATAIALSPDAGHVFTLSLDHQIKAWNTRTGKTGVHTDLLGENQKEAHGIPQYLIDPHHKTPLKIVEVDNKPDGDIYYIVATSPRDHQFKFWAVSDADSVAHGIRDVQEDTKLIPPLEELLNTNAGQIVDFAVKPGDGWRNTQLWILARVGKVCKTFTLTFDLLASPEDLEDVWRNNWVTVNEGPLAEDALLHHPQYPIEQDLVASGPSSPTDRWLDFLFFPGRFTTSQLESALHIYKTGLKLPTGKSTAVGAETLKQRLCNAVAAKVELVRDADGALEFNRYQVEIAAQWQTFFGVVRLLLKKRSECLSLSLDTETSLPWLVRADYVSPLRVCSELEVLQLNETIFTTQEDDFIHNYMPLAESLSETCVPVARLLAGARQFRRGLSASFQSSFTAAATGDASKLGIDGTPNGVQDKHSQDVYNLYEGCALHAEVSDEDFNGLTDSMQNLGGLGELDNDTFHAAIQRLNEAASGNDDEQALTRYGDRTTIRVSQETLVSACEIILDLLALVVFMAGDLEAEELSDEFNASELYEVLMAKLKEHKVLLWLASHTREEPARQAKNSLEHSEADKPVSQPVLTILESIFIGDWQSLHFPEKPLPGLITYWCRAWTYGADLTVAYNGVVMHVMGNLLKYGDFDLASDFTHFLPENPWSIYLRGRLELALGYYELAAALFRQASDSLAEKNLKIESFDTCGLLSVSQKHAFGDGTPRYFLHVSSLYEAAKLHTYTADFASIALQELAVDNDNFGDESFADLDTRKQGMHESPAAMRVDLAMEELRLIKVRELKEEILGRTFSASLQTCRYKQAFDALLMFGNPALRKASLQSLLQSLLTTKSMNTLLALPFPEHLLSEVDAILVSLARKHLAFSPIPTPGVPQYHQVIYTWRVHNNDFRGAAEILFERLQRLRHASAKVFEPDDETLLEAYLVLINTLACCGPEEGWILAETVAADNTKGQGKAKRKIVTLQDVRREYQSELDRRSDIQQGRFALVGGDDAMDLF